MGYLVTRDDDDGSSLGEYPDDCEFQFSTEQWMGVTIKIGNLTSQRRVLTPLYLLESSLTLTLYLTREQEAGLITAVTQLINSKAFNHYESKDCGTLKCLILSIS